MVIWGILEDNSGNLWLSGNNGLSRFNPKTEECRNYNRYDGLQGNQFTMRAYHQGEDGEMFFGGVNGFNAFYPEDIKDNPFMPAVAITDFKIANKSVSTGKQEDGRTILNKSITATNEIELSYKDNVEFQFAALHYAASENNKYAYMLEGFDNGWNYTDAQHRFAIYKNMNPGKYVFKVKASNNDGLWNEEGVSLQIIVIPPFWQTAWFKSVCGLLALAGLIGIYEIKVRAIKAHKVALEAQVVKRTSELEEATEALKKSNEERIEHALQLQRMEAEHVHQIDLMKLRFFTNISHEFRTPLTLILGPLEKMLSGGETSRKHLAMMYRNAQNLQRLMNQILDFRKLESGKLKLEASFGDIIEFIAKIVDSFQPLADRKNIDYKFRSSVEILEGWFDTDKLDKILCNLLANALKFTPDGGKVSIFVKSVTCSKTGEHHNSALSSEKWVHIKVCDTGIGVDANKIRLLFDRFYQVDDQSTRQFEGTGIGLALAKDLVELHYGSIEVTSEKGEGSTFIVKIPIGKEYLKSDEVIEHVLPLGSESAGAKIPILDIAAGSPAEEAAYQNMEEQQSAPVILIVEDNADMRSYICDELSSQYRVCQAADGIEGMDKAFESVPDLIIADVMMPQMNGEQMCQRLKSDERTNHIPLIMLTARSSEEHTIQGLESGADDYIAKPFNMQILKTRVSNLLDSRRKLREKYSRQIWLEPNDIAMESVDEKFLRRAMEIVEEHMSDSQFGVEMFSKNLFMSRMNLYRKLKALTGQTPNQFIRTLRLKKAAKLLVECGMSVTEAMYEVGFNSFSYFRKVFREQFGLPPAEYAASQRQGKTEQLKPGI